jgi:hypothetical protein
MVLSDIGHKSQVILKLIVHLPLITRSILVECQYGPGRLGLQMRWVEMGILGWVEKRINLEGL